MMYLPVLFHSPSHRLIIIIGEKLLFGTNLSETWD